MSHTFLHARIAKAAYCLLPNEYKKHFPKQLKRAFVDNVLNPDYVQFLMSFLSYDKYNHMNTADRLYEGGLVKAKKHYSKLVKMLKQGKGAFDASWLAHFIVDCLEPMHHFTYKSKGSGYSHLSYVWRHTIIEIRTNRLKVIPRLKPEGFDDIGAYLDEKREKIRGLHVQDDNDWPRVLSAYQDVIIPTMVSAVASVWKKAIVESDELEDKTAIPAS